MNLHALFFAARENLPMREGVFMSTSIRRFMEFMSMSSGGTNEKGETHAVERGLELFFKGAGE